MTTTKAPPRRPPIDIGYDPDQPVHRPEFGGKRPLTKLSKVHYDAIALILSGADLRAVAAALNVSYATVRGWKLSAVFVDALEEARRRRWADAIDTMQDAAIEAAQYLRKAVKDGRKTDATGVRAAQGILDTVRAQIATKPAPVQVEDPTAQLDIAEVLATLAKDHPHLLRAALDSKGDPKE
jgi:hypothetical protein